NTSNGWQRLTNQLYPLATDFCAQPGGDSRQISTGLRQARDEAARNRIRDESKHHRDRRNPALRRPGAVHGRDDDHVHVERDQFGEEFGEAVQLSVGPSVLDGDALALDVPPLTPSMGEAPEEVETRGS